MAFREVGVLEIKEVLRLWKGGVAKKRIAAQLGMDIKTVRRYLKALERCGLEPACELEKATAAVVERLEAVHSRPRGAGWERCVAHREFIAAKLKDGVRLTKVRKLLKRQREVQVSYATLYRFAVEELGFGQGAATIPVLDCGPGEELQLDTGWIGWLEIDLFGRRRRLRAWIFSAVLSRHRFVYPVLPESTATAIEACEAAWEFFGGVFKVLIPDNTKAIVDKADALAPKLILGFLEYAQSRGFHVDPARVRSPRDKARVERAVQTVRDDCFGGEQLRCLEQAREHARRWCLEEYGLRRHSTTQRMPLEHFEAEERAVLLPAPSEPYDIPLWSDPKVGRDQLAAVAKALYSLPTHYRGKTLRARADRHTVCFYDRLTLVKTHPRVAPGKRQIDTSDFPPEKAAYAFRDLAYLARRAAEHGDSVGRFAQILLEGPLPWARMRQVYALLGLARRYGSARLQEACAIAVQADMIDVYRLRKLLEIAPVPTANTPARVIPLSRYLRPPQQYALPLASREPKQKGENA
jgi:transposase